MRREGRSARVGRDYFYSRFGRSFTFTVVLSLVQLGGQRDRSPRASYRSEFPCFFHFIFPVTVVWVSWRFVRHHLYRNRPGTCDFVVVCWRFCVALNKGAIVVTAARKSHFLVLIDWSTSQHHVTPFFLFLERNAELISAGQYATYCANKTLVTKNFSKFFKRKNHFEEFLTFINKKSSLMPVNRTYQFFS